jgi:hypothetical protein
MKQFTTVEDYLEVLAGMRDVETGAVNATWIFTRKPIINLARYDVGFVDTVAETTIGKNPLTDRQAELACKILLKYRKQLSRKEVDVSPIETPVYRLPLREIDRSKLLYIKNNHLHMKFAYNTEIITALKDAAKESNGTLKWDHDLKVWVIGLTEPNLTIAVEIARRYQFEIADEVVDLYTSVQKIEADPYAIELQLTDSECIITNAASSLIDYVNNLLGGFGHKNLHRLVDYSSVLGYTVSNEIKQLLTQNNQPVDYMLSMQHLIKQNPDVHSLKEIFEYATLTDRWPIYVYDPRLNSLFKHTVIETFGSENILDTTSTVYTDAILPIEGKKIVFMNKYNTTWENNIPLLVSTQGMMFGGEKTILLQRAEKVVYCAAEVYNKKNTAKIKKI